MTNANSMNISQDYIDYSIAISREKFIRDNESDVIEATRKGIQAGISQATAQLQPVIDEQKYTINEQKSTISEQSLKINEQKSTISEQSSKISEQKLMLNEKDERIRELEERLASFCEGSKLDK